MEITTCVMVVERVPWFTEVVDVQLCPPSLLVARAHDLVLGDAQGHLERYKLLPLVLL